MSFANTCSEHFFAIFSPLFQNLTEKIDTDSGEFVDADSTTYSGVTVDMISYDSTNEQLLMKVDGADTVIPFKKGQMNDINPNKTNSYYLMVAASSSMRRTVFPIGNYVTLCLKATWPSYISTVYIKYDGSTLTGPTITSAWVNYTIPENVAAIRFDCTSLYAEDYNQIYYALLTS